MRRREDGFTSHEGTNAIGALVIIALVVFAAAQLDVPWWQKILAVIVGLGAWVAGGIVVSIAVIWAFMHAERALTALKARKLRRLLQDAQAGDAEALRRLENAGDFRDPEDFGKALDRSPALAADCAAAARGKLRGPVVRILLHHGKWHPDAAAALAESVETMDTRILRRWLFWLGLYLPDGPERDDQLAKAAELAFARMTEEERRHSWSEFLGRVTTGGPWQRLATLYPDDLRYLESTDRLKPSEKAGLRRLRGEAALVDAV